jgi:hypothetical protein
LGHRTLHVADPAGFVVEFAQEIPGRAAGRDQRRTVDGGASTHPWLSG